MIKNKLNPKFESDKINPQLATSPWSTNRIFAYNLINVIQPKTIVELGTHYGCSLFAFLQSIKDNNLNTKVYAIDTWEGDPITDFYDGQKVLKLVKTTISLLYNKQNVNLIQKKFFDSIKLFDNNSIDIIHIDGNHSYDSVKEDFESWLPKIKDNGIILLHDIGKKAKKHKYGSYKYWGEIKNKFITIEQKHDWGLGIVFPKGNQLYEKISELNIPFFEEYQLNNLYKIQNHDLTNMVKIRDEYIKQLENTTSCNQLKKLENLKLLDTQVDLLIRNRMNLKIAILLGSPAISGGTYVIFQHALALQKYGYTVTIITEKTFDHEILYWFQEANKLEFIDLETASKRYFGLCIATWWKTIFYIPKINASKFAYFVQSIESRFFKDSEILLKKVIESSYDIPFYYLTEAHWIQKYLQDEHKQTSKLVLNGIDKNIFNTTGNVLDKTRKHGPRVLVEGALNVFFKQTELGVKIAKKAGVKDIWLITPTKIKYYPGTTRTFSEIPLKQVGEIMRSCDIILKFSKVEGMYGPPLEMMHCGGTVVTFNVTGYDEYIKDGINGLVYPMNDINGAIKGLSELIKDKKFIDELKKNGLKTAKNWPSWNNSTSNFIKTINSIIEDKNEQNIDNIKSISNFLRNFYISENYRNNSIKLTFKALLKNIYNKIKSSI